MRQLRRFFSLFFSFLSNKSVADNSIGLVALRWKAVGRNYLCRLCLDIHRRSVHHQSNDLRNPNWTDSTRLRDNDGRWKMSKRPERGNSVEIDAERIRSYPNQNREEGKSDRRLHTVASVPALEILRRLSPLIRHVTEADKPEEDKNAWIPRADKSNRFSRCFLFSPDAANSAITTVLRVLMFEIFGK